MTSPKQNLPQAKLTNRQHAKSGGQTCPFCRGTSIEAVGAIMPDDRDSASLEVECRDCGRGWKDIYKLVGYEFEADTEPCEETTGAALENSNP